MQYQTPESQEMGTADELIKVIYGGWDIEASTGLSGYTDPLIEVIFNEPDIEMSA